MQIRSVRCFLLSYVFPEPVEWDYYGGRRKVVKRDAIQNAYPDWLKWGNIREIVEVGDHPWFLGCQFHPEFKSKPLAPHPLFSSFIAAALTEKK